MVLDKKLWIYNTLSREKQEFKTIHPGRVGMYVCGPTVYGNAHLGHARAYVSFDIVYRTLLHLGFKVRYVRNITDVGHLENDADEGEDKIAKKAKLELLEPMEVVQLYTNSFHEDMNALGILPPSIEPHASGHIIEQILLIESIIAKGFAYESEGSVYFDVLAYNKHYPYGELSGRVLEDLIAHAGESRRSLAGKTEKRNSFDFALWKKAQPEHIMRWPSPWSDGFPGWHIECTAMSSKYLGETFDIHGGGMDLLFPHHECEIAQAKAGHNHAPANYWLHNNMITINGQKMGKSLGNSISLKELFAGEHKLLTRAYSPTNVRFFILQAQYRSTLDFSNEALEASDKGYKRLSQAIVQLDKITASQESTIDVAAIEAKLYQAILDDLNTPIVIAELFECASIVHKLLSNQAKITQIDLDKFKSVLHTFYYDILGLSIEKQHNNEALDAALNLLIEFRDQAKKGRDFATSDAIRDTLLSHGIQLKDSKEGTEWSIL